MRLGSANIQNYPDLTPAKVKADAKKIADQCTIFGAQEIQAEDWPVVLEGLNERTARVTKGGEWSVIKKRYETPIFYRSDLWHAYDKTAVLLPNREDFILTPKNSAITGAIFQNLKQAGLPHFAVVNCHLITDGVKGPGALPRRLEQWQIEYDLWRQQVDYYFQQRVTVFALGDTNNGQTLFPAKSGKWLSETASNPRIDKIGVRNHTSRKTGSRFLLNHTWRVKLNSDHDLLVVEGSLNSN